MLNLDNGGTAETGKTHAGVVLQHANLWGRDHVGSLQYTTTAEEPGKVSVWGAGYHIPLYQRGDSVDLYASYSNVDSGSVTAGIFNIAVSGKGAVAGGRYNQTLARRGEIESRLVYGLDYKAYKNNVVFAGVNLGNDVTVHPLSIGYGMSTPAGGGDADLSATLVQNIAGGSRGRAADFALARSGARASYRLLRFAGAFSRTVAQEWQLRALLNGQWSGDALVPGEQFGAGGSSTVRGFEERALSTDSGAALNLEAFTPNLCGAGGRWQCRALAFYDTARGSRNKALPGELKSTSIASTGVGLRAAMGASFSLQVDYSHVLRAGATGATDRNKVHLRLGLAY